MAVEIFFCYAHEDEAFLKKLKTQLSPLQKQGLINVWYDRNISAGSEWEKEIDKHLNTAQIILLLISPDFIDSDYCYGIEMKRAIELYERGKARVIPIILRPSLWRETPLSKLQALPKDAEPVSRWPNLDDALYSIAENIRDIVRLLRNAQEEQARKAQEEQARITLERFRNAQEEQVMPKPSPPSTAQPIQPSKPGTIQPSTSVLKEQSAKAEPLVTPEDFLQTFHRRRKQQPVQPEPLVMPEDFSWLCIRTLSGHQSQVNSVAISPDGQTLASGSNDQTIKLWKK